MGKHRRRAKAIVKLRRKAILPRIVSLFSGAGGLDLGFVAAGFKIAVAFDISAAAVRTHARNFPGSTAIAGDLITLGPGGVAKRVRQVLPDGARIGLIGGPPCQGFSRANTRAKPNDPRNDLPNLYLKIVEKLQQYYQVEFVVFENVLGMRDKKHASSYDKLLAGLRRRLDLDVTEKELCALDFGVPQTRRRIVLSALRKARGRSEIRPRRRKGLTSVRQAIANIPEPAFYAQGLTQQDIPHHPNHWTMNPRSPRFHSKGIDANGRSFKQLKWTKPSPTIAFGHREIYVHPNGRRRLSIFEAMLLQGFPSEFVLEGNLSEQVEQVSNAVPPPLAKSVASAIKRTLAG